MDAPNEALVEMSFSEARADLETVFRAQYERIARVIAGITKDPARAEELAVEVFLKWERTPKVQQQGFEGWLYRTAVRTGLNELRRAARRSRYERLFACMTSGGPVRSAADEAMTAQEEEQKVRLVLGVIQPRQAELLLLRANGLTYEELASTLNLNPASVGTLLSRALQAFSKEFTRRYGKERYER